MNHKSAIQATSLKLIAPFSKILTTQLRDKEMIIKKKENK